MKFVEEDRGVRLGRDFEDDMGVWGYYFTPFLSEITKIAKEVEKALNLPVDRKSVV